MALLRQISQKKDINTNNGIGGCSMNNTISMNMNMNMNSIPMNHLSHSLTIINNHQNTPSHPIIGRLNRDNSNEIVNKRLEGSGRATPSQANNQNIMRDITSVSLMIFCHFIILEISLYQNLCLDYS